MSPSKPFIWSLAALKITAGSESNANAAAASPFAHCWMMPTSSRIQTPRAWVAMMRSLSRG